MRKHQFHVSPAAVAMFEHKNTACMCSVIHHCLNPIQNSPLDALYIISTKSQSGRVGSLFPWFPYVHLNSQEPMPASLGEILWDFSRNWSKHGKLSSLDPTIRSTNVSVTTVFEIRYNRNASMTEWWKKTQQNTGVLGLFWTHDSCRPRLWILPRQIGQVSPATNPPKRLEDRNHTTKGTLVTCNKMMSSHTQKHT